MLHDLIYETHSIKASILWSGWMLILFQGPEGLTKVEHPPEVRADIENEMMRQNLDALS